MLIDLIVASELPDADEEDGSDGEDESGALILMQFSFNNDIRKLYFYFLFPYVCII